MILVYAYIMAVQTFYLRDVNLQMNWRRDSDDWNLWQIKRVDIRHINVWCFWQYSICKSTRDGVAYQVIKCTGAMSGTSSKSKHSRCKHAGIHIKFTGMMQLTAARVDGFGNSGNETRIVKISQGIEIALEKRLFIKP